MNWGESLLVVDGSRGGLDMGDQLWGVFVAGLGEMHFIADPQRRAFLSITSIKVIGRIDQLGCWQCRFNSPLPALVERLKLLLED